MCKSEKVTESKPKKEWPSARGVFLFMGIVFSLTMAFLISWPLLQKKVPIHKVSIELTIPQDSIEIKQILKENDANIERLCLDLRKQSQEISDKYELLIKSQESETDFFKLVSCIAAFIVALLGFLGYRTIKDIEDRVEKSAKIKAEETAKKIVEEQMAVTVEQKLNNMVSNSVAGELIRRQIMDKITNEISRPLEDRIEKQKRKVDLLNTRVNKIAKGEADYPSEEQEDTPTEEPTPAPEFEVATEEKEGGES